MTSLLELNKVIGVVLALSIISVGFFLATYINEEYWKPNYASHCTGVFAGLSATDCGLTWPMRFFLSAVVSFIFSSLTITFAHGIMTLPGNVFLGTGGEYAANQALWNKESGFKNEKTSRTPSMHLPLQTIFFMFFLVFYFILTYLLVAWVWSNIVTITYVAFIFLMLFVPLMRFVLESALYSGVRYK